MAPLAAAGIGQKRAAGNPDCHLRRLFPDPGVKLLQVRNGLALVVRTAAEHIIGPFQQLPHSFNDLVWMHIEVLRQFRQCPLALERSQRDLGLEFR